MSADTSAAHPGERYAWYVVFVLLIAYTCSFIDRMILTLVLQPIRIEFDVTDTQVSLLVGFAFAILYTFLGLPLGYLADRGNRKLIIMAGILLWSVMTAVSGLVPTFALLFLARIGVGVGEAALSPAAYSLMADYFARDRLGKAISVYSIGVPLGSGIALILGGLIVNWVSQFDTVTLPIIGAAAPWRLIFMLVGVPGVAVALLILTVREPPRRHEAAPDGAPQGTRLADTLAFVAANRALFVPLFGGLSLLTMVMYGAMAWIPTFFARSYGIAPATAGLWFGIVLAVGGAIGLLLGGSVADRLFARGRHDGHVRTIMIAVLGSMPFFVAGPLMPSAGMALACVAAAMLISSMHGGVAGAAIQIVTPNRYRAQITALYLFIANLIGFGLGATAVALVTDTVFGRDEALRYALSIVALIALPVSAVCLTFALKPFRDHAAPSAE